MPGAWRYRCPRGHASWHSTREGYYCDRCRENGQEHKFDELVDMKTDTLIEDP